MHFETKHLIGYGLVLVGGIMVLSSVSSFSSYTTPNYVAPAIGTALVIGGLVVALRKGNAAPTITTK